MDRGTFIKLMEETNAGDAITSVIEDNGPCVKIGHLVIENMDEDVNIIILPDRPGLNGFDRNEVLLIQWYKLYHWGRCLMTVGINSEEEMEIVLTWVKEQIEEYEE